MKNKSIFAFLLMHIGFLVYSAYTLLGKRASAYDFLTPRYCFLYCCVILILFIYALIWQQILKVIKLSTAICNKAITIIWGMLFSSLLFNEDITIKKIFGASVIVCGILLLSFSDKTGRGSE